MVVDTIRDMTAPATASAPRSNPYAIPAFVLAVLVVVVMLASRVVSVLAPALTYAWHLPIVALGTLIQGLGIIAVAMAVVTAAIGVAGVTRPGRPHGLAAVGLGVGVTAAATYLLNLLASALVVAASTPR
jgi:galactitol-specific phosphotransferase system IIC component